MAHEHGSAIIACLSTVSSCWVNWYDVIGDGFALMVALASFILVMILIRKHLIETRIIEENGRRKKERRKYKRDNVGGKQ